MAAPVVPIVIGGLFAWSIYRRVRRNIGRQRLRPVRSTISIVIFLLASVVIGGMALFSGRSLLGLGGGILMGVPLGFLGLRLTQFETAAEGRFYTPDARIGLALSLLFIGRLMYRFWAVRNVMSAPQSPAPFQSPLTFFIFGLLAGYYIVYHAGLIARARENTPNLSDVRKNCTAG